MLFIKINENRHFAYVLLLVVWNYKGLRKCIILYVRKFDTHRDRSLYIVLCKDNNKLRCWNRLGCKWRLEGKWQVSILIFMENSYFLLFLLEFIHIWIFSTKQNSYKFVTKQKKKRFLNVSIYYMRHLLFKIL